MAGRPRVISDDRILAAVATAVGKVGPSRLTLADVAREAEVSTGALVQRFGTKRGLLLAFLRAADPAAVMRRAASTRDDPLDGLVEALVALAGPDRAPAEFANHLAFLHLELADEEFRADLAAFDAAVRAELLSYVDDPALVDALIGLFHGVQITWAIRRDGTLAAALRSALEVLLAPRRPIRRVIRPPSR
jgi:AcrR family transcriptional regulator